MSLGADMPAPYSGDLRDRVAAAVAAGASARSAAGRFGVSIGTAIRWAQRWRAEGHAEARAMGGDHRSRLIEHRAAVLELVARQPDLTLQEIRGVLTAQYGITVGLTTLWRFLKAQKITRKKRASRPPSRIVLT
jgi:transposase